MHVLCGVRRDEAVERLPELRRRFCATPDPADAAMAAGRLRDGTPAVGQACAPEVQPGGRRRALRGDQGRGAGEALGLVGWAKRSVPTMANHDCGRVVGTAPERLCPPYEAVNLLYRASGECDSLSR